MASPAESAPRSERHTWRVPAGWPAGAASASWRERCAYLLAVGGPIGWIPWVPATWASLATAAVWRGLVAAGWSRGSGWPVAAAAAVMLVVGGFAATTAERLAGIGDPRNVVLDEIAGQSLTFLLAGAASWPLALAGFVLFRIFDVLKPPPARQAERARGGWGIMLDDVVAGGYAAAALWLLAKFL